MRQRRVRGAVAFASVLLLDLATSSPAHAADPALAREQVKIGYQLAQDGKCEEALPHFVESLRLDPKAITLINLASCEEKTSRLAEALGHWVEARARAQAEGNGAIEEEAEKRAKALDPRLPKLTVVLVGAPLEADVERDGVSLGAASMGVALPVNPGTHTLVLRAKGHEDATETVSIAEGEAKRVELAVGPTKRVVVATPEKVVGGPSPLVFIGFGTALVGVAVGTVTGLMAFGKASTARDKCPARACDAEGRDAVETGRTLGTVSTVGFLAFGAGAAVGTFGLLWRRTEARSSVAVSVGPTGARLSGNF